MFGTTRCVIEFEFWTKKQIEKILNFISCNGAENISCKFPEHEKQIEEDFREHYINRY